MSLRGNASSQQCSVVESGLCPTCYIFLELFGPCRESSTNAASGSPTHVILDFRAVSQSVHWGAELSKSLFNGHHDLTTSSAATASRCLHVGALALVI